MQIDQTEISQFGLFAFEYILLYSFIFLRLFQELDDNPISNIYYFVFHTINNFNIFQNTIRTLYDSFVVDAEHYLGCSLESYQYYTYTEKSHLILEINNSIDSFHCKMYSSYGVKVRSSTRKYYDPIDPVLAKQLFNLTIELLYDYQNINIFKDKYFKQTDLLTHERNPIEGLILNADVAFNEIRSKIEERINIIENRMINFDDSKSNRNELRGELNGLKFSLKILDMNR